ncbi:hypothetical protein KQI63_12395 [bacterium]|nr:hypothetical protein [bacterium]
MRYLLSLLVLLSAVNVFAEERPFSVEFSPSFFATEWNGPEKIHLIFGGDDSEVYDYIKPTWGAGLSIGLWHDTNPWLGLGLTYMSGRHLPMLYPSFSGLNFVDADKTESWQLTSRLMTPSHKEKRGSSLFLRLGLDYTRTGWQVHNANLWGEDVPEETLDAARGHMGQWSATTGLGMLLGRRAGFHLTLEWEYGFPIYSNSDKLFNLNVLSLKLGL